MATRIRKTLPVTEVTTAPLTRSEKMKAALQAKRNAMPDPGFHPCIFCGAAIPSDRCKDAIARGKEPQYCSEDCRANKPHKSLATRIYACALGASKTSEAAWQLDYQTRLAMALNNANGRKPCRRSNKK